MCRRGSLRCCSVDVREGQELAHGLRTMVEVGVGDDLESGIGLARTRDGDVTPPGVR
jgi:hypothetical protein